MRIVFVHPRGAGQFRHLIASLAEEGHEVALLCESADVALPGVTVQRLASPRITPNLPAPLAFAERYAGNGHRTAEALEAIGRRRPPDLVVGHIGWGDLLFARDVLPATPTIGYCEFFLSPEGGDVGFDPAEPALTADRLRIRARNMAQLSSLEAMSGGISPTRWQRSRYPHWARQKISVCHEGVDIDLCRPGAPERAVLPGGVVLSPGEPIVTFAARSLEPCRGFPQFMRAAAALARRRPEVRFVVVGGDDVSYGAPPPGGGTWRQELMTETGLDPSRVVFTGWLPHAALINLFRLSSVHVYLTTPFVLSWSVLEAMACGSLVIGSATPPVEEVIEDGRNGLLVDFWAVDALADMMLEAVRRPARFQSIREAAAQTIADRFALHDCLDRQRAILRRFAAG